MLDLLVYLYTCVLGCSFINMVVLLFSRLLGKMLPKDNQLPDSRQRAQSIIMSLGMEYNRINACVNDCVLFHKEHAYKDSCPKCEEARYKEGMQSTTVPRKVLRHFPLRSKGSSELLT